MPPDHTASGVFDGAVAVLVILLAQVQYVIFGDD